MKRTCSAASLAGLLVVTQTVADQPSLPDLIRQSRLRQQTLGPVFGEPTPVASPSPLAQQVAADLRAELRGLKLGTTSRTDPRASSNSTTAAAATANGGSLSVAPADARQKAALERLRALAGSTFEVHLRPENQTVRQLRSADLLSAPLRSRASPSAAVAPSKEKLARVFLQEHRELFRLSDPDQELQTRSIEEDLIGHTHIRFRQTYYGRRVALAEISAHFDMEGRLAIVDGAYIPTPRASEVAAEPVLTAEEAITAAQTSVPGGFRGTATTPELIIHAPLDGPPTLAYETNLRVGFAQSWRLTVNARDGSILHRESRIKDQGTNGSGIDQFGVSRPLNIWQRVNTYYFADTSKSMFKAGFDPVTNPKGVITVLDARKKGINQLDDNSVFPITSTNPNQWSLAAGVSALFNFSQTYDYFLDRHQRNSINGNGGNVTAVVNVGNYDNASWHGDLSMMFFGDAKKYPGALDVVAHELAHGVTENSANLVYELQPGAMNEAFSDVFGECVEARTRGQNDWKMGTELGRPFRDMKNPGSITISGLNRPYPSKMSEFVKLANSPNQDHGGVHINSSIINHAFYQLASGLPGSIGIPDAERIFYRALTQHLKARSQFLDCRLACIASAGSLFGAGSPQAARTAEAFDRTEIYSGPTPPPPAPLPTVNAPDSLMFVYFDKAENISNLGRREGALNDDPNLGNFKFSFDVRSTRPSITGDGEFVIYVDSLKTVCLTPTADPKMETCILSTRGFVHSIALSPDASLGAFVLFNTATDQPDGQISVFTIGDNSTTKTYNLVSPGIDGDSIDQIISADSLVFSTDSTELIYDARSRLRFNGGSAVEGWSIFSLNLATERTAILVPPLEEYDTGNPAIGRAGNRYLAFDAIRRADGENAVLVLDTFTGDAEGIAANGKVPGYPAFTGDESSLLFSKADNSPSGSSLMLQKLSTNRLVTVGTPGLFYADATLGALYRRGAFVGKNEPPTVQLQSSTTNLTAPGPVVLTATATDTDGQIARVEFYDGPSKIGETTSQPYRLNWTAPSRGEFRVSARAIDNLGQASDSPMIRILVDPQTIPAGQLSATLIAGSSLRITLKAAPGNYFLQQSSNLTLWTDYANLSVGANGTGIIDETGGAATSARFFRVRK